MKIYNEQIALQSQKPREVFNITTQVKAAAEKSGLRNGIAVVSSLHSSTAILIHEDDATLGEEFTGWLSEISVPHETAERHGHAESGFAYFYSFLLQHQVVVPITDGRLDLDARQAILFLDIEGLRPRRIVVKIIGE